MNLLVIGVGGAVGSVLRYLMSTGIYTMLGRGFPYGTLAVNVAGCWIMGFLYVLLVERFALGTEWRAALLIGLIGGFTTFSAFSMETITLLEQGEQLKAVMNILLSVLLCLGATWIGVIAGRQI